jgi:phospholipid transport system transporter-binding protein
MNPDSMNETKIVREGTFHFKVHGAMTFEHAKDLLQESVALFSSQSQVEIDLTHVNRADSAGLALIFEWMALAAERDIQILIKGVPDAIHAIAQLCQVESLLDQVTV